jgi:hypothetical protein
MLPASDGLGLLVLGAAAIAAGMLWSARKREARG